MQVELFTKLSTYGSTLELPESIKAVISCLSTTTGTSLEHLLNVLGVWVEEWYGVTCCCPFSCCLHMVGFGSDQEGMLQVYWLCCGVWPHSHVPPSLFNGFARVAPSLDIWPQPWHLKHCRALESFAFLGIALGTCECLGTPPTLGSSSYLLAAEELWVESVLVQAVWPLWELGQTGVFMSIYPLPWPLCLGLFGVVAGCVPCSALFRVAISLVIWSPSSFEPSVTSVAADDLALTFPLASSISLSAFLAVTMSWEYVVSGLLCKYLIEFLRCCAPMEKSVLEMACHLWSTILLGHLSWIWFKVPSSLLARRALSHGYPG